MREKNYFLTTEISKTVMYEFLYDYVKSKHEGKTKLCYMDTDSFIGYIIYKKKHLRRHCK